MYKKNEKTLQICLAMRFHLHQFQCPLQKLNKFLILKWNIPIQSLTLMSPKTKWALYDNNIINLLKFYPNLIL